MPDSILVVDDQDSIRHFMERTLAAGGYKVRCAADGARAVAEFEEAEPDLVLLDLRLPDTTGLTLLDRFKGQSPHVPVIMMTAHAEVETAVQAMKQGATDYLTKPVHLEQLRLVCSKAIEGRRMAKELELHRRAEQERFARSFVRGVSPRMVQVYATAERVAKSETTSVFITGESGTGKEIIAHFIHSSSPRAGRPFLEVNCAAIPKELLESELFGHEKGAFTDARTQKLGLLELADGGCLFLDEIGEMPPSLQVKLLKALESMTFRRVGGTRDLRVSVRILSATNQDLPAMVREGRFRGDLYYRLMVVPIALPPLRERREDIPLLARHYLERYATAFGRRFRDVSPGAERLLVEYEWPGNIRELRNLIERTVLLEDGELLEERHLRLNRAQGPGGTESLLQSLQRIIVDGEVGAEGINFEGIMMRVEEALILRASETTGWNQSRTAELLGIKRDKLRYRMKLHGMNEAMRIP